MEAVRELGGGDEDMRRLLTDSKLVNQVAELIMSDRQKVSDTYKVVVDYGKTLVEMIQSGKYDYVNDDISDKHFPIKGFGQQEAELVMVHLSKCATTKEVLEHLNSLGLESAKVEHLLAFGTAYPEIQKEFPVITLGSVWVRDNGGRYCPLLTCVDARRMLNLHWGDGGSHWDNDCRFLALRK